MNSKWEFFNLSAQNMTIFGDKGLAKIIKVNKVIRVGSDAMASAFL